MPLLTATTTVTTTVAQVPGAHQDGADLYGIVLALAVIVVTIAVVRLIFRKR